MPGRAVHFSLSEAEVAAFRGLDRRARIVHLHEIVEPDYFDNQPDRMAQSDKAWDAIHRALGNGRCDLRVVGDYPLTHVILGGEVLSEDDVVIVLKTPGQVRDVAAALPSLTRETFRKRYDAIEAGGYEGPFGDLDFDYTWDWFEDIRVFWLRAAEEGRSVLFTVGV